MSRKVIFMLVVALATFAYLFVANGQGNKADEGNCVVGSEEVKESSQADIQVIDVRTPGEYSSGHVEGAKNIDIYSPTFQEQINQLDKSKNYYVYCKSGGRSGKAQKLMQEMGFTKVCNVNGGVTKLHADGVKLVR